MTNSASGSRVPGGALPRSARLDNRTTASMANSIKESFASDTAPGRRIQSAMPAATPTPVMMKRAARNTSDSVDRELRYQTLEAACSARLAGFQIVRMTISRKIQAGGLASFRYVPYASPSAERCSARAGCSASGTCAALPLRFWNRKRAPSIYT